MSSNTSNQTIDIPTFLEPAGQNGGMDSIKALRVFEIFETVADGFGIDQEMAAVTVLGGVSQCLGGAKLAACSHGNIALPFNILLATPESRPIWTEVPLRIFWGDQSQEPRSGPSPQGANPAQGKVEKPAGYRPQDVLVRELCCRSPRSPHDPYITLSTPAGGLLKAFRHLSANDVIQLEDALVDEYHSQASPGEGHQPGLPSFLWQIPRREAGTLLRENPWIGRLPFLLLEADQPGIPELDPDAPAVRIIDRACRGAFELRRARAGNPEIYHMNEPVWQPAIDLLLKAQQWEMDAQEAGVVPVRWTAELAIRLAILLAVVGGTGKPSDQDVQAGCELAKVLVLRHISNLSKYAAPEVNPAADITDLTDLEQRFYLRVCERGPISPIVVGRSFNNLRANQRDEIIAKLIAGHFIENSGRLLQKTAA